MLGGDWDDDLDTLGRNESFEDSVAEVEDEWSGELSCPSCES